jgi:hypothetical protein
VWNPVSQSYRKKQIEGTGGPDAMDEDFTIRKKKTIRRRKSSNEKNLRY